MGDKDSAKDVGDENLDEEVKEETEDEKVNISEASVYFQCVCSHGSLDSNMISFLRGSKAIAACKTT